MMKKYDIQTVILETACALAIIGIVAWVVLLQTAPGSHRLESFFYGDEYNAYIEVTGVNMTLHQYVILVRSQSLPFLMATGDQKNEASK